MSRTSKVGVQILLDSALILCAFWGAGLMAGSTDVFGGLGALAFVISLVAGIASFYQLGVYRSLVRFTSATTLAGMALGAIVVVAVFFLVARFVGLDIAWPQLADYLMLTAIFTIFSRFVMRSYLRASFVMAGDRVIIYGAGELARQLLTLLQQGSAYSPVALIDNRGGMAGAQVGGVEVYAPEALEELVKKYKVSDVLIATQAVTQKTMASISDVLASQPVAIRQIPAVDDIMSGRAKITQLRDVRIEELLGRPPVPPVPEYLHKTTTGKVVMVTGAGGSIGSEIVRQVAMVKPASLVLFESSEFALYEIDRALRSLYPDLQVFPVLGSVCNERLMKTTFKRFDIDTVFHAAAYKHVPMLEGNTVAAIENNVLGTMVCLREAVTAGVGSFTMVSTDKAVRPRNVMGASKRLAELICQAYAQSAPATDISIVRFGNVLGSSGSVIPLFRDQIAAGGPVTITDVNITRYFMTIPEASQLVIQASGMAEGGEVFVLDMGEPIKIIDLAEKMIRLSGFEPHYPDGQDKQDAYKIDIEFTGLRPGEKLYEELFWSDDTSASAHPRIMKAQEGRMERDALDDALERLQICVDQQDAETVREILKELPLGYTNGEGKSPPSPPHQVGSDVHV